MKIKVSLPEAEKKRVIRAVQGYTKEKQQAVRDTLKRAGFKVETQAKLNLAANGSVQTGRLRSSVSTNWTGSGQARGKTSLPAKSGDGVSQPTERSGFFVFVGTNVQYARRVEHGFYGKDSLGRRYAQEGKPYLYPAYLGLEGETITAVKQIFKRGKERPKG